MFADSLLESSPHFGRRSAWSKIASLILQGAAIAVALAIPLFHIERLQTIPPPPSIRMTSVQQPPSVEPRMSSSSSTAPTAPSQFIQPRFIPRNIPPGEDRAQTPPGATSLGPPCGVNCATGVQITDIIQPGSMVIPPPRPHVPAGPVRVSDWQLGALVRRVLPDYPDIARQAHLQGAVVLLATIGKDGRVENVQAVSGPPMFIEPARRAVRQWQYRPYLLNHDPVVVQTQITVNFVLNRE